MLLLLHERRLGRGKPARKLTRDEGISALSVVTTELSKLWRVGQAWRIH